MSKFITLNSKLKFTFHLPRFYWETITLDPEDLDYPEIKIRRHIGGRFDTSFSFNLYGNSFGFITFSVLGFGFQLNFKR